LHFVRTLKRCGEAAVEQMHVRIEREARRVMAEPTLDLDDVPALRKQPGGDRVSERVEACPPDPGLPGGAASVVTTPCAQALQGVGRSRAVVDNRLTAR
jgi:hypothetical protein